MVWVMKLESWPFYIFQLERKKSNTIFRLLHSIVKLIGRENRGWENRFHVLAMILYVIEAKVEITDQFVSYVYRGARAAVWENFKDNPFFDISTEHPTTYYEDMERAVFCLCPLGWAPWSLRLVETVIFGCIPVIIVNDIFYPLLMQSHGKKLGYLLTRKMFQIWTPYSFPFHLKWYWGSRDCLQTLQWSRQCYSHNLLKQEMLSIKFWIDLLENCLMIEVFTLSQVRRS